MGRFVIELMLEAGSTAGITLGITGVDRIWDTDGVYNAPVATLYPSTLTVIEI